MRSLSLRAISRNDRPTREPNGSEPNSMLTRAGADEAGAEGFEPSTAGLGTRCPVQTRLRAP